MMITRAALAAIALLLAGTAIAQDSDQETEPDGTIGLTEGLALARWGGYGRQPLGRDALVWHLSQGTLPTPEAGLSIEAPDGETLTWEPMEAGDDGWFTGRSMAGGYLAFVVDMPEPRTMILYAQGHSKVYVNGELRTGDVYATYETRAPVLLRQGENVLLFQGGRGRVRARLEPPAQPISLSAHDALMPDLIVGEELDGWGSVMLTNATTETVTGLVLEAQVEGEGSVRTLVPPLTPLSFREVPLGIQAEATEQEGEATLTVGLLQDERTIGSLDLTVTIAAPDSLHRRTFLSDIDGSVQYYAVQPARPVPARDAEPALVLSLHGASVEARGQAAAYSSKRWAHIVAPTNRRPYGFDWEDWGRLDALEVLEHAKSLYPYDPERVYLTGHSMGGHGTWHLGVTFPDLFAAIGPSAGWITFWTYASGDDDPAAPVEQLLRRARLPGETLTMVGNTRTQGIYILHGADDDNVPADQARTMVEVLSEFHKDFEYHEEPGAGHWWDRSDEPGADCVDWAPLFDFFARHSLRPIDAVRDVRFTTASPGVSADSGWVRIEDQVTPLSPSTVDIRFDPWQRRFVGTTQNVRRLSFSVDHVHPGEPLSVTLDEQTIEAIRWPTEGRIWLSGDEGGWQVTGRPDPAVKGPHRYGTFKDAFRNRMVFVYATGGSPEEQRLSYAKARYDAETFWYRGNGSVDVVADADFDPAAEPDRNVILYGNAGTNAAWGELLGASPLRVEPGRVAWADEQIEGEALTCLFIRPRPGSGTASVGAVGVTGALGYHTAELARYFVSGTAYPDYVVFGPDTAATGNAGALLAGFFGSDWTLESGEVVIAGAG